MKVLFLAASILALPFACRSGEGEPAPVACRSPESPYRLKGSRDGWIVGASAVGAIGALIISNSNRSLTARDIDQLSRESVNRFDRSATYRFSEGLSDASYVVVGVTVAAPLALLLDAEVRDEWETCLSMYAETMALGVVLPAIAKSGAQRIRPFVYNPDVPMEKKLGLDPEGSFFSRHTTLAFASAVFLCTVYDEYHPRSAARPYVWTGSLLAAAGVGYMRYESGQHFPTDIIVGAIAGSVIGYAIPALHRAQIERLSIAPGVSGSLVGLTIQVEM